VRYLARAARDPGAAVERRLRFEALEAAGGDTGSVSGSYLGKVPPMPTVRRWVGDEFPGFEASEPPHVRLIVLWSIQQNDLMPIDGWVRELAAKYTDDGLELLSILSAIDDDAADDYLASHAWPGYLCVDEIGEGGIGLTFDDYDIARFNLPRLLLCDIDGKVVWEGDPGFRIGTGYETGEASYLDSPLKELIEKRDLKALVAWHGRWAAAQENARAGDFTSVIGVLDEAEDFDAKIDRNVARAVAMKAAVKRAAESPLELGETFAERGATPSIRVLVAWGEALGVTYNKRTDKALKKLLRADAVRDWDKVETECRRVILHLDTERREAKLDELEATLAKLEGGLVAELLEDLQRARERDKDMTAFLEDVPLRPARWLSQRYFAW
jgi:transcriptional regulator with XRE-family HTH domain